MIQQRANFIALFEKVTLAISGFLLLQWDFFSAYYIFYSVFSSHNHTFFDDTFTVFSNNLVSIVTLILSVLQTHLLIGEREVQLGKLYVC